MREKQSSVSPTTFVEKTKWVINLSSRTLNEAEVSLLKKGLNFAVTPTRVQATKIIAKIESAVRPLDAERADTIRRSINTMLQQAQPSTPNITKEQQEALKSLKEDNSIMVLPADKGRASVILDADTSQKCQG